MINFNDLTKKEREQVIDLVPKLVAVEFIKKADKKLPEELRRERKGGRIDLKSTFFQQRLPIILMKGWEKREKGIVNLIQNGIRDTTTEVNKYILAETGEVNFIQKTIVTREAVAYMKLLELMSARLESKYFMLFFKLNKNELNPECKKLMEDSIIEFNKYAEQKEKLKSELEEKFKEEFSKRIKEKEENYQVFLNQERATTQKLKQELKEKEQKIKLLQKDNENKERAVKVKESECVQLLKALDSTNKKVIQSNEKAAKELEEFQKRDKQEKQKFRELKTKLDIEQKAREDLQGEIEKLRIAHYDNFSKEYIAQWEECHGELLEKKKGVESEIEELEIKEGLLKVEITDLQKCKEELEVTIQETSIIVESLKDEIATQAVQMSNVVKTENNLYIKKGNKETDIHISERIGDFSDILESNLRNIGVKKVATSWADYIVSVLAAKRTPLIVGYETREVAKAISYAYAGESPLVIALNGGYNNPNELVELYRKTESSVILIEGAIGQMNEGIVLPLLKEYLEEEGEHTEKIILLSCEDEEVLKLIPTYLFNYMAIVQIEEMYPVINVKYELQDSRVEIKEIRKNNLDIDKAYKKLRKLFKDTTFTKGYLISRSLILAYLYQVMIEEAAIECLMRCDLKIIFGYVDEREQIAQNIDHNRKDFEESLKEIIA